MRCTLALLLVGSALAVPAIVDQETGGEDVSDLSSVKNDKCVAKSLSLRSWKVSNLVFRSSRVFTTPAHQNAWASVNFELENPAVDYKASCVGQSSMPNDFFFGDIDYICWLPNEKGVFKGDRAVFKFERPSNYMILNQTWTCADSDSLFIGEGAHKIDLDCKEDNWKNPDWKIGKIYSNDTVVCEPVDFEASVKRIRGWLYRKEGKATAFVDRSH